MNPKPRVVVTWPIGDVVLNRLKQVCEVIVNPEPRSLTQDELLAYVPGATAILCLLTNQINTQILDAAGSSLKLISTMSVGYDHVDIAACTQRNIVVTYTPGTSDEAVAEHAIALMLCLAKSIPSADNFVRSGQYIGWDPKLFVGPELSGKVIGIVGLGRIGLNVARIAGYGFRMGIAYTDVQPSQTFEAQYNAKYFPIDQLVSIADIISLHVPLLPATTHLINSERLARMKKSAFLINTSRGPVVDEAALVDALKNGQIAGAGLDVFENEPAIIPELMQLPNVVFTPHTASATYEARVAMADKAVNSVLTFFSGQMPLDVVKQ